MSFSELRAELDGELGLPGSETYSQGRTVWYPPARKREPLAVVRPTGAEDLAKTVGWARRTGVRLSPRSGGHSFDGFPVQPETVLLDLSQLNDAQLSSNGVLRVQPGARALALAQSLSPHGRALPTGDCGTVALGGLLSGGGFGYASRALGLTIDSVIGATVVTGAGDVLQVSEDEYPELFWASRGGGGTAGFVTEYMVRSFAVDHVTAFSIDWAWESAREAVMAFDERISSAPREFDLKLKIRTTGKDRFLDTASSGPAGCSPGTPVVEMSGQFLGDRTEAETLLAPLLSHSGVRNASVKEENYFDAMLDLTPLPSLNDPAPPTLRPMRVASDFTRSRLDSSFADVVVRYIESLQYSPELWGGCILLEPCDGAVHDTPGNSTAFPHRQDRLLLQWELVQPPEEADEDIAMLDTLLADTRNALAPHISGGRYLNYADRLDHPASWWGGNLARLRSVAAHYDPDGLIVSRLFPAGTA